jgi:hypothetical protein
MFYRHRHSSTDGKFFDGPSVEIFTAKFTVNSDGIPAIEADRP